ncbi:hypothetical protein SJA_C2-03920 [Sphingobium indicum UT26S]|uniref:Uncharacterized protein n=1 Tax=Sphingobium indicum (strain DSM 16413 / CCM 7287 / MTCC 6362 / UT26 / NBRC 101211 / UT26S) TaxID=452662 RepID=D4Z8D6_SPHIU|nr:hypothetical protein SJA_C2-03920 [Sphingobium indicum UT26S]
MIFFSWAAVTIRSILSPRMPHLRSMASQGDERGQGSCPYAHLAQVRLIRKGRGSFQRFRLVPRMEFMFVHHTDLERLYNNSCRVETVAACNITVRD